MNAVFLRISWCKEGRCSLSRLLKSFWSFRSLINNLCRLTELIVYFVCLFSHFSDIIAMSFLLLFKDTVIHARNFIRQCPGIFLNEFLLFYSVPSLACLPSFLLPLAFQHFSIFPSSHASPFCWSIIQAGLFVCSLSPSLSPFQIGCEVVRKVLFVSLIHITQWKSVQKKRMNSEMNAIGEVRPSRVVSGMQLNRKIYCNIE